MSELTAPGAVTPRLRLPSKARSVLADSATMAGRCLRMARRNLDVALTSLALPVLLMLLFVYLDLPLGTSPVRAVAWCLGILVASVAVSGVLFRLRTA